VEVNTGVGGGRSGGEGGKRIKVKGSVGAMTKEEHKIMSDRRKLYLVVKEKIVI
jgi:hypothetical protein